MKHSENIEIVAAFAKEIEESLNLDDSIIISASNFNVFNVNNLSSHEVKGLNWQFQVNKNSKYTLVFGDFPLGWKPNVELDFGAEKLNLRRNWAEILTALTFLEEEGLAVFLMEPTA